MNYDSWKASEPEDQSPEYMREERPMNRQEFINAVKVMENAMRKVSELWPHDDGNIPGMKEYPFADSFDELCSRVTFWRESLEYGPERETR